MGGRKLTQLRRVLTGALVLGLAAAALVFALRGLDWQTLHSQIRMLDWRWLGVAVLFDVAGYVAQGVRWRCLLQSATLWQTTRAIYAGLFLNEIVPLRPGEAVRAWLASRDLKVGIVTVASTMLTERLMDLLWLATAALAVLTIAPLPASLIRIVWIVALVAASLVATALLPGRAMRLPVIDRVRSGLANAPALFTSGGFLVAQGLAFWAVTRASHLGLDIAAAFVVMVVVRIGTMIPGAPANLGTHQFSTVLGLSLYGVSRAAAAGFSLVVFAVLTAPLLIIGFAACVSAGLSWRGVRNVMRGTSASRIDRQQHQDGRRSVEKADTETADQNESHQKNRHCDPNQTRRKDQGQKCHRDRQNQRQQYPTPIHFNQSGVSCAISVKDCVDRQHQKQS